MRQSWLLVGSLVALPAIALYSHRTSNENSSRAMRASRPSAPAVRTAPLPDLGALPALSGGTGWINGAPITREALAGHVALIEIWTFSCGNCLNALPHIISTAARYKADGLVTIGVHTPETEHEKVPENVARRVKQLGIVFPVVMDNDFAIWHAFDNHYWPSVYLVDKRGRIRFHHIGEGRYGEIDAAVQALLAE